MDCWTGALTMDSSEESHDVDIAILPDDEQPKNVTENGDTLPHFQFLDGRGTLQNSIDRPIEGFVALKLTYEHVFKKQREQARMLQQKNQQLAAEIQQLKRGKDESVSHTEVKRNRYDTEIANSESSETTKFGGNQHQPVTANDDTEDLKSQLATSKADKSKLRSGLIRLARCLLEREPGYSPLSDILKKILENLQSSQCDSEESLRELCLLVEDMGDLEDTALKQNNQESSTNQKLPTVTCSTENSSMLAKSSPPSDSSLQKIVANYQQNSLLRCQDGENETQKKIEEDEQLPHVEIPTERDMCLEEDMYGPESTGAHTDLVPYNLKRLHRKLNRLLNFPAEYRSMVQHIASASLMQQQMMTSSWHGNIVTSQQNLATDTRPVSSPPRLPADDMLSFIGIHSIKLPPTDLPQPGHTCQTTVRNQESPVSTCYSETLAVGSRQGSVSTGYQPLGKSVTPVSFEGKVNEINASLQFKQQPNARKFPDQGFSTNSINTRQVKSNFPKDSLSFELARGPPTNSPVVALDANTVPEWHSGVIRNCVSGASPPINQTLASSASTAGKAKFVVSPTVCKPQNVPSLAKPKNTTPKDSELTLVDECPQGPYIPGSGSVHDELVTAHSSMHYVPGSCMTQMECPVCQQKFPPDTSEEKISGHVNFHFDGTQLKDDGFEILNT